MCGCPLSRVVALLALAALMSAARPLAATTYCVHDASELDVAVTASSSNGVDDEIRIRQGTYGFADPIAAIALLAVMNNTESLDISGGWTGSAGTCSSQVPVAGKTRLVTDTGSNRQQLLQVRISAGASGELAVSNLNFTSGYAAERGGCLMVSGDAPGNAVTIRVDRNEFFVCRAPHGAAISITASAGSVRVRGNAFVANQMTAAGGAVGVLTPGPDVFVSNNTFEGNVGVSTSITGYVASGTGVHWLSNNIFASDGTDIHVTPSTALIRNVYGSISGTPSLLQQNFIGDPGFSGQFDITLAPDSVARNSGANLPIGGALNLDIDGNSRPIEGGMDRGALEYPHLFGSGFE